MRIIHITEAWVGGIATYVENLADFQAKSPEFEEVHLIYSENRTPDKINIDNIKCHSYTSSRNPLKLGKIAKNIKAIINEINPDIIHLHSTFPGVYGRLHKLRKTDGTPIKIVYCAHGWSFQQESNPLARLIYRKIEKHLAKRTDAIINISRHEHSAAQSAKALAKNNYVVLSGVRDKAPAPAPAIHPSGDKLNLGFVGRLDYKKGFDILADAASNCKRSDMELYIIGEKERDDINLPAKDNFHYLGWVDNTEIDNYISQLDALIVPSRQEGLGLVVLEAMRNEKPVIISDGGALHEMVIEGYNGYIFSLANPKELTGIIDSLDKERLDEMGRNARLVFENNFREERQHKMITQIYLEILYN